MGKIIHLDEYRRKRCMEALMLDIGLPDYCEECGEDIEALLLAGVLEDMDDDLTTILHATPPPAATAPRRRQRASAARKSRKKD